MLAYILTNENFETIKQQTIINSAVDISNRKSPKSKVKRLSVGSQTVVNFKEMANIMLPLFAQSKSVCFGKDDFAAFNQSLRENELEQVTGTFYNIEEFIRKCLVDFPTNLKSISEHLGIKHDRHNPLSDSTVAKGCFIHLLRNYSLNQMEYKIPSRNISK